MAPIRELRNAFCQEFLASLDQRDDPPTALEAETAEPWVLQQEGDRFGLFRPWEGFEKGDVPAGVFHSFEVGLLFRLIWPAVGRDSIFVQKPTPTTEGFAVETSGSYVGHLRTFNPDAIFAAHIAGHLLRSPQALAFLVWLAGPTAQDQIGRILGSLANSAPAKEIREDDTHPG